MAKAALRTGEMRHRARKLTKLISRARVSRTERAQVIVVFTISLFALMLLMMLILDGGLLLLRKREAQASADSGTLAGVVYLCGNTPDFITAASEAEYYAVTLNQATFIDPPTFPGDGDQIRVVAHITQSPALAGLLGFGDITVEAFAIAQCQNAGSGSALMPFVFVCEPPGIIDSDSEQCVQKIYDPDNPEGDDAEYGYYYMIHNSDPADDDLVCIDPPNTSPSDDPPSDPPYMEGALDCDWDGDGIDDIIDSANRAWISLEAGQGIGASTLSDWIENGFEGEIPIHVWAAGAPGVANSVFSTVEDLEDPDFPVVLVPIYDDVCNFSDPEVDCPSPRWHNDSTPPDTIMIVSGHQKYYHIIGFAGFQITCVHNTGNDDCPFRDVVDPAGDWLGQSLPATIEGYFVSVVSSDFGSGGGTDTGAYIIRLIR